MSTPKVKHPDGLRRYAEWAGNPQGVREDVACCVEEVWPNDRRMIPSQCSRKRGRGPRRLYCAQHWKMEEARLVRIAGADRGLR